MLTEFVSLLLTREELLEIREALLMRAMVEDDLRRMDGLEDVGKRLLLDKIEQLALADTRSSIQTQRRLDDELWQHAWLSYTDEWAWFRAKQDVMKELGDMALQTPEAQIEDLTHRRYHKSFNAYVAELDMEQEGSDRRSKVKKPKKK
ncbi:hypothetical protein KJZ71_04875 [Patescibacteria group bacterium]|jgi:hypothetical protein|uniref:Uncharacterized protein n=1 Tax=candidate division WWE3 bacterium TaxID=2053526 RepID=A0A928TPW4_UNCKA|nr:hypothetical protein [candidate division WWE3 bacterium]MCL4733101.1 hypothetical protein [Patescibacteria group bacterium]MDL1953467.1 hypothetical protein [Candidatus Uhrbacteria bacterium UHB]RIL00484.1 MAG: hypothetical protein DCC77_02875 [Candidatus Uhrbacteria bacterium]